VLRRGAADAVLVGGADAKVNPISMMRQCLFTPLSRRNDAPEEACRPFERDRDGVVLGEGAGVLVLEDREHARARGAPVYGEVLGFGAAFDRRRDGAGLARAVRIALEQAEVEPGQLDHVNAHGYGARQTDAWEARGLREALGPAADAVHVFAPKSYFGNLGAAGGLVELTASLLAHRHGALPGTLNYQVACPECPVRALREERPVSRGHFLKVGLTERGQCAVVVVRCAG
jgi:3-oxoacyl-[acyl-carrier-protein] synthase II